MNQHVSGADIKTGRLTAEEYRRNFKDKQHLLTDVTAAVEAYRCFYCDDAPCTAACPTDIDVPSFINMIASGNRPSMLNR